MKFISLFFGLLIGNAVCLAQKISREPLPQGSHFLRFNLTNLINPVEPSVSLGYEYQVGENISVSADAGWVYYSNYFEGIKNTTGILLRPAIRWYPGQKERYYGEIEFHYKHVNYTFEDWIGRNCVNEIPNYEEYTSFKYEKKVTGINLKGGIVEPVTRNKKIWIDVYIGIGLRKKSEGIADEANSCYDIQGVIFPGTGNENNFGLSLPIGIRFLLKL